MERSTRCAWIKQNDANTTTHVPFLCGAAAAQMILYGRDDSKFQGANLKDGTAQLRVDQKLVWDAIVAQSQTCPLPSGSRYDGDPEQTQICETGGPCWATYPEALARTLTAGVTVTAGPVAGSAAQVISVRDESQLPEAIVNSLDRGMAAALLIDNGVHWVVVYKYRESREDAFEIFYRDGKNGKRSSTFWDDDAFFLHVDQGRAGVFRSKYVAVTAAPRLPVVRDGLTRPAVRRRMPSERPTGMLPDRKKRVFTPADAERLQTDLRADDEWARTFAGAHIDRVLSVRDQSAEGMDYYLVDFVDGSRRRVGSVIVDAYSLRRRDVVGIEQPDDALPPLIALDEVTRRIGPLNIGHVRIEPDLMWQPSDQSSSRFEPFHVVQDLTRSIPAAFVRADGAVFTSLTQTLAGI
jgi:hypothetical protein